MLVYSANGELGDALVERVRMMMKEVEVGDEFVGKVVKTTTFGAFVELAKGTDGLLHISNVSPGERIASVEDVLNKGDEINVRVVEVDRERGRIGLRLADDPEIAGKSVEELATVGAGGGGRRASSSSPRNNGREGGSRGSDRDRGRGERRLGPSPPRRRQRPLLSVTEKEAGSTVSGDPRGEGHRITTLDVGRQGGERTDAGGALGRAGLLDRRGLGARGRAPGRDLAPARAHALPRLAQLQLGGDRPDLRRDGRGVQRGHRQGGDLGVHARARRAPGARVRRDRGDGVAPADSSRRGAAGDLEAEREVVLEEIAMYEDDPQDRVFDVLGEAVFGEHPLGRAVIGRADVVGALTSDQLRAFHAERYSPADVVISAAGSIDHDTLVEMGERCSPQVAESSSGSETPDAALQASADAAGQPGRLLTPSAVAQRHNASPTLSGGCSSCAGRPSSTTSASEAAGSRATTSGASRCGYSTTCSAAAPPRGSFRRCASAGASRTRCSPSRTSTPHTGEVGLYVGTRPENLAQALEVIAGELERFVREPADAQELERSRGERQGPSGAGAGVHGGTDEQAGSSVLCDLPILSVEEIIARIDAVTVEDLRELATDLFRGPSLSVAAIGPDEDALREALGPLEAVAA